jgi:biopolymer transport protein ExbB
MEIYSIVAFFQKGGLFMYPILLVFVAGMAITVERWVQLSRIRSVNREMWNVLYPLLTKGEFDKAREITNEASLSWRRAHRTWPCSLISPPCWDCLAPSWG